MRRRGFISFLAAAISSSLSSALAGTSPVTQRPRVVSLIRLIATPDAYDGRRLRLMGYLCNNGLDRSLGLYVSEPDGRNFIASNSIDLGEIDESTLKLAGKYIVLEAIFRASKGTDAEYLNGRLDEVTGVKEWASGDIK